MKNSFSRKDFSGRMRLFFETVYSLSSCHSRHAHWKHSTICHKPNAKMGAAIVSTHPWKKVPETWVLWEWRWPLRVMSGNSERRTTTSRDLLLLGSRGRFHNFFESETTNQLTKLLAVVFHGEHEDLHLYLSKGNEHTAQAGCLSWGCKVIIPPAQLKMVYNSRLKYIIHDFKDTAYA